MDHLRTLNGRGIIAIGGKDAGEVSYNIEVYRSTPRRGAEKLLPQGRGHVEGDAAMIGRFDAARRAVLRLADGGTVTILPKRATGNRADVVTTDAISGV